MTGDAIAGSPPAPDDVVPDAAGDVSGGAPAPRRTVPAGAFVVALMVAVACACLAVLALVLRPGGDDEAQDARLAAGRFTDAFLTIEYDALDEWKAGVLALSTVGFADELDAAESLIETLVVADQIDAVPEITAVFVGDEDRGSIQTVVRYDWTLTGSGGVRTQPDRYLELTLLRVEEQWLVDDVVDIHLESDAASG